MDATDRKLLAQLQRGVPPVPDPWSALGEELGLSGQEVMARVKRLRQSGAVREISAVFDPGRLRYVSALAALEVEPARLDSVAAAINAYPEVTHNYEREHSYNLWFALTAPSKQRLQEIYLEAKALPGVRRGALLPALRQFKLSVHFEG
jgi:DNA-binding Lrp family transcriptional regulator